MAAKQETEAVAAGLTAAKNRDLETLEAALSSAGLDFTRVERNPDSTIVPVTRKIDTAGKRALAGLNLPEEGGQPSLILKGILGEGGMGQVHAAEQCALGREVAVKTLKPTGRDRAATLSLLREAWVTGSLEHPNVVPVHDIVSDENGSPQVVLKKIEGVDWSELIHNNALVRERFCVNDALEWNLRILLQVCDALRYAHSKKIIHRDLKPENVMIGTFGEVYLVDWGLAVSLVDDGTGRYPLAADANNIAGTPAYMAPEMLGRHVGGHVGGLDERTDIYLLGSVLYEILCGQPPHMGANLMALVAKIVAGPPTVPRWVPNELMQLIGRAMAFNPEERFDSVEEFQTAVKRYLGHQDAQRLADLARARLVELESVLARQERGESWADDAYALFRECRFGLRHALSVWPESEEIQEDLTRAILMMVEFELTMEQPKAAQGLLGELEVAPQRWVEAVEQALSQQYAAEAEMRRLQADLDPTRGRATRWFASVLTVAVWTIIPIGAAIATDYGVYTPSTAHSVLHTAGLLIFMSILGLWARESLLATAINRRVSFATLLTFFIQFGMNLVAWAEDVSVWANYRSQFPLWIAIMSMLAMTVDWWLMISVAGYIAGYCVLLSWPEQALWVIGAIKVILFLNVGILWSRPRHNLRGASDSLSKQRRAKAELAHRLGDKQGEN